MNRVYTYRPQALTITELDLLEPELVDLLTHCRFIVGTGGRPLSKTKEWLTIRTPDAQ